jgi:hypothetical protein
MAHDHNAHALRSSRSGYRQFEGQAKSRHADEKCLRERPDTGEPSKRGAAVYIGLYRSCNGWMKVENSTISLRL